MDNFSTEEHLRIAFSHLQQAVKLSIQDLKKSQEGKKRITSMWEAFVTQFFQYVKEQSRQNNVNLLSLSSFLQLKKFF